MKKTFSTLFMAAGLLATTLFTSCSDDDNTSSGGGVTASKEYKLYNLSSGTAVEAGTVVFSQLADSSASAQVTLNSGYRQSGTTYTANIVTSGNATAVYSNLTGVDGGVGTSTTSPVKRAVDNISVKYSTLIGLTGYQVRVLAGSVVQGTATIQ